MATIDDLAERVIRACDRGALGELFATLRDPLYHFLHRLTGDAADAEDATQETFRRVLAAMPALREPRAFRGWTYKIARRVAWDQRQARRKAAGALTKLPLPLEATAMNADFEHVNRAVEALDEDLRVTVRLRYEQDLGYEEIAEAMDCPPGTVAKRLHTAHERLRTVLAGAGFALTVAALSELLARGPRLVAPPGVTAALDQMVREARLQPGAAGLSLAMKSLFVAVPLLLVVISSAVVAGRTIMTGSEQDPATAAAPVTSAAPTPTPPVTKTKASPSSSPRASTAADPCELSGVVCDRAGGAPVGEARVTLHLLEVAPVPDPIEAAAAGDGSFRLKAPPGKYEINVVAPGYVPYLLERNFESVWLNNVGGDSKAAEEAMAPLTLTAGGTLSRKIHLVKAARIRGRVLDVQGVPVAGARIRAPGQQDPSSQCGFAIDPEISNGGLTDHDGRFAIDGVYPRGVLKVEATALGFEPAAAEATLGDGMTNIEIRMTPGLDLTITLVTARGDPLTGATLAVGVDGGITFPDANVGRDGRVVLRDLPKSSGFMAVYKPGYVPLFADVEVMSGGGLHLVLTEATGSASGRVVDGEGGPVAGIRVRVYHYDWSASGRRIGMNFVALNSGITCVAHGFDRDRVIQIHLPASARPPEAITGADGRFRLAGVAFEGVDVCIVAEGDGFKRTARPGHAGDLGDIVVEPYGK